MDNFVVQFFANHPRKKLLNSTVNCDILKEIRYWLNLSELSHYTESLRELVISRGKFSFQIKFKVTRLNLSSVYLIFLNLLKIFSNSILQKEKSALDTTAQK